MVGRTPEERRGLAERQECRGRHVDHQPAVAEESEGQAIETTEGEAGRRESDAQAFQGDGPGCVQADVWQVRINSLPTSLCATAFPFAQNHARLAGPSPTELNAEAESLKARP